MNQLTDTQWRARETQIKRQITLAKKARTADGTLAEKIDHQRVQKSHEEALRQHRLNYHSLVQPIIVDATIDEFYIQDSRNVVGNSILWWGVEGEGYTTDVSRARVLTRAEAVAQNACRETDIPWAKAYVDARTRPVVDVQFVNIAVALESAAMTLHQEPKSKPKQRANCHACGGFISEQQVYQGCPRCKADNRP